MKDSVKVALGKLNEVLNYEKLHSNVMITLKKTKENPLHFVLFLFGIFKMQADNADLQLMLPNAADTADLNYPYVKIDTQKISKVLRNLISNAIKYTPQGGTRPDSSKELLLPSVLEMDFAAPGGRLRRLAVDQSVQHGNRNHAGEHRSRLQ